MSTFGFWLCAAMACAGCSLASAQPQEPTCCTLVDQEDPAASPVVTDLPHSMPVVSTPVVLGVDHAPIPLKGGDGRYHLVYELNLENFTGEEVQAEQLQVLDASNRVAVASLDSLEIGNRLVVRDAAATPGVLGASQLGILYLHVIFERPEDIPPVLEHRLTTSSDAVINVATAARTQVAPSTSLVLDAPLRGARYFDGDGCCDLTRHVRATLALNGSAFNAQRFAIDWEQLDEQDRFYVGDPTAPQSYIIYGKPTYAVADARVIAAVDGRPDSPIGALPNTPVEEADGNYVVLDLGGHAFALYAHLEPGSVQVRAGELVHRGQVLGRVGTSGNSSEPHLHFQVTDGPEPLLSNGIPYLVRRFTATRQGVSTAAFVQAVIDGEPLPTLPLPGPARHEGELPLDLWIVDFP